MLIKLDVSGYRITRNEVAEDLGISFHPCPEVLPSNFSLMHVMYNSNKIEWNCVKIDVFSNACVTCVPDMKWFKRVQDGVEDVNNLRPVRFTRKNQMNRGNSV